MSGNESMPVKIRWAIRCRGTSMATSTASEVIPRQKATGNPRTRVSAKVVAIRVIMGALFDQPSRVAAEIFRRAPGS